MPIRGIQFNAEPYAKFLGSPAGLRAWLDQVLAPVRAARDKWFPDKELCLCYDPREQHLSGWDFARAVSLVQSLAPMVYAGAFSGQGEWGDPVLAIRRAHGQCPGDRIFRPLLQTYQIDPQQTVASYVATVTLGGKPGLFRRGVTPTATWRAIESYAPPPAPAPPPPPPPAPDPGTPVPPPPPPALDAVDASKLLKVGLADLAVEVLRAVAGLTPARDAVDAIIAELVARAPDAERWRRMAALVKEAAGQEG